MEELLVECIDALRVPAWDPQDRAEHIRLLRRCARRRTVPKDLRRLFERIEQELSVRHSTVSAALDHELASRRIALVDELLESDHVELPRFVYHGTIRGRLASISKHGLQPAFKPVWKDPTLDDQCDIRFEADGELLINVFRPGRACWFERCESPWRMSVVYCEGEEPAEACE